MRRVPAHFFFPVILFFFFSATAQSYPNTLLWRISGKHLSKPCYLFGTMHLTDKRLFRFGDSLYAALEKSDGMAIELNPDELGAYFMNQAFESSVKSKTAKEILGDKEFGRYSKPLAKKIGKNANEITSADILAEKNRWISDYMEKGEMPAVVDAYLYNIARKSGKWVGGIEDVSDQMDPADDIVDRSDIISILNNNPGETDSTLEHMMRIYAAENLSEIEKWASPAMQGSKDLALIRRNVKMARRMDSLSAFRSMFFAVGAAHLPGDSGVISLLKKRGFTVEPVFSSRKLEPSQYQVKEVDLPWKELADSSMAYRISMPENTGSFKLMGVLDTRFYFDMASNSVYCVMAAPVLFNGMSRDSLFRSFAGSVMKGSETYSINTIHQSGLEGMEYIDSGSTKMRVRVFLGDKTMYMLLGTGIKKSVLQSPDMLRFLNSFTLMDPAGKKQFLFTDSIMGIQFSSPVKLEYNRQISNNADKSWKISSFTGTDAGSGSYIMLFSKEIRPGYYITSDSVIHAATMQQFDKEYKIYSTGTAHAGAVPYRDMRGRYIKQPDVHMRVASIVHNNRNILLLAIADSTALYNDPLDGIFSSLRIMDPPPVHWSRQDAPGSSFSAWVPSAFRVNPTETESSTVSFVAYDTTTSSSYMIMADTMGKYFWTGDEEAFWNEKLKSGLADEGEVIQSSRVNGSNMRGVEVLLKNGNGILYKRLRILVSGKLIYRVFVSGEKSMVMDENANRFFSGIRFQDPAEEYFTQSKAQLLLNDLSADSAVRRTAYNSITNAGFTLQDSSLLYQYLFHNYLSPFNNQAGTATNLQLGKKLVSLHPGGLIPFICTAYDRLVKEGREDMKPVAISLLAAMQTKESFDALASLLARSTLRQRVRFDYGEGLTDSLALSEHIWPALQPLVTDTVMGLHVADLASTLIDSARIQHLPLEFQNGLVELAMKLAPSYRSERLFFDVNIYTLLTLLANIHSPAANAALKEYLPANNKYLGKRAAVLLLKNKQALPAGTLQKMAADISLRYSLHTELSDAGLGSLFPAAYAGRTSLMESVLFNLADDDIGQVKISFLSKKTATFHKTSYDFYLYKVIGEDSSVYLGIGGGFKPGSVSATLANDLCGLHFVVSFNNTNILAYLKEYLQQKEEEEKEEEN